MAGLAAGAVPSLLHLAHLPGNLPRLEDLPHIPHFLLLSRQRALLVIALLLLGVYIAVDLRARLDHLNTQVTTLRDDLRAAKRRRQPTFSLPLPAPNADASISAGAAQLRAARDVLQGLGPALVTPSVRRKKGKDNGGGDPKEGVGEKRAGRQQQPSTPKGAVVIEPTPPTDIADDRVTTGSSVFPYLLNNPDLCTGAAEVAYLLYIHSAPENFRRRRALRGTWAQPDLFLQGLGGGGDEKGQPISSRVIFLLGATENSTAQEMVEAESRRYSDIVQVDFIDSDCNLTHKGIAALKWISHHCPQAKYIIKANDDTFVNIFILMDLLTHNYSSRRRFMMCLIWDKMPILRPRRFSHTDPNRCKTDDDRFSNRKYYPRYCSGAAYFLSGAIIPELYEASRNVTYFWIDDVYVTGLLTQQVSGIEWIQEGRRYRYKASIFQKHYNTARQVCLMVTVVSREADMWSSWVLALKHISHSQKLLIGEEKYEALLKQAQSDVLDKL